jgi:hypothetical protein
MGRTPLGAPVSTRARRRSFAARESISSLSEITLFRGRGCLSSLIRIAIGVFAPLISRTIQHPAKDGVLGVLPMV